MLYREGVSGYTLDVALAAEDHQALAVGDDVLYSHAAVGLCAHHCAAGAAKLGGNLVSF